MLGSRGSALGLSLISYIKDRYKNLNMQYLKHLFSIIYTFKLYQIASLHYNTTRNHNKTPYNQTKKTF